MEIRKVIHNGSTHLISIPAKIAAALRLSPSDYVTLTLTDDNILELRKVNPQSRQTAKKSMKTKRLK